MVVTVAGMSIIAAFLASVNAERPIEVMPLGIMMDVTAVEIADVP